MPLSVGRITYANSLPFFHYLRDSGFTGEIVDGVPSELNRMLDAGDIDVCPSSSFEYAQHSSEYLILPEHSISSVGPVHSVLLFAPVPMSSLDDVPIALTGESATSVNLLQVLLKEFCGVSQCRCFVPDTDVEEIMADGHPTLMIGDRALRASRVVPDGMQIYDLGAIWYHYTGLPFVFALWLVRRQAARERAEEVASFVRQLRAARTRAFESLSAIVGDYVDGVPLGPEELIRYWRGISYDLTDGHLEGLRLFFYLCQKHGLLEDAPELAFLASG